MVRKLDASRPAFKSDFADFLKMERGTGHDVASIVATSHTSSIRQAHAA